MSYFKRKPFNCAVCLPVYIVAILHIVSANFDFVYFLLNLSASGIVSPLAIRIIQKLKL